MKRNQGNSDCFGEREQRQMDLQLTEEQHRDKEVNGMCGHSGHHGHHGYAGWCCCAPAAWGPGFPMRWRFPSREERITWLEEYLKELQAEVEAVRERLAALRETD